MACLDAPTQVTVYETVIELENITTTQGVSVLVARPCVTTPP